MPRILTERLRDMVNARVSWPALIDRMVEHAMGDDPKLSLSAISWLANRGFGTPMPEDVSMTLDELLKRCEPVNGAKADAPQV